MKKVIIFIFIANCFLGSCGALITSETVPQMNQTPSSLEDRLIISISFPEFQDDWIESLPQGHQLNIKGFDELATPGCPSLPVKNIMLGLPPHSTILSINFTVRDTQQLPGFYQILSVSSPLPYTIQKIKPIPQEKNMQIYDSDNAYPANPVIIRTIGSIRQYSYLSVSICPFVYNPVSGRLFYSSAIDIILQCRYEQTPNKQLTENYEADQLASTLFSNYDQIKRYYHQSMSDAPVLSEIAEYVIITSNDLVDAITQSNFIVWKNAIGYTTKILCVTDQDIAAQPGMDLAEKIRNYLRTSYLELGIKYVLFVGDYQTVPMRYCYPNPSNHQNTAGTPGGTGGEVPTDYYYADLSNPDETSWDADGDGYYGEYGQDHPDFYPEVYVGRIPVNNPSKIIYTLNKIVSFEQDIGEWKHHALAPGAFFYFSNETAPNTGPMDGARIGAVIADDFMDDWTVSRYTEAQGLESSAFPGAPLTEPAWTQDWKNNQYAIVNWGAHGWSNLIARKVWATDDGDHIPEANEMTWPTMLSTASTLDDDYPSLVTSISCYVGYPEPNNWGNLGIDLLTLPGFGASVGIISSARTPYGNLDWPTDLGGSDSLIYEFNNNIINRSQTVGEAFYQAKFFCNLHYGWTSNEEYIDLYTFNLYGDPSLRFEGIQGSVPQITILKPENALYIFNHKIMKLSVPLLIGALDVEVNASDEGSGISYVQFLINGKVQGNITTKPYIWKWTQRTIGKQILTVRAYNATGSFASDEILVRKFF